MSDNETTTSEPGQISRRTLAKGVAWAVPAVAVASAAPAHAASVTTTTTTVAQCVSEIANTSRHWEVDGAQYSRCNCRDHVDVRLKFTVTESNCPYTCVKIRVRNVAGASTWCWGGTGTGAWLTKTATLSGGGFTYPAQRLNANPDTSTVNDGLYFRAFYTGGVRDNLDNNVGICNADGYVGINDGMHINPCSRGPYFEWQISYDCGTNWSSSYFWGDTTLVPPPDGCTPTYGTTTTTTTRPTRSSESSDTETSGDGEVGESTNGGDMTQSASGETASTDMAQGASGGTVETASSGVSPAPDSAVVIEQG